MRVAVITDIRANQPALEAALTAIEAIGVDAVFCGGDLVGYGPHPNEVCALIEKRGIPTIYGNYDYAIARELDDCGCAYVTPHDRELGQRSVEWTLTHTGVPAKAFMRDLPFDLRFAMGDRWVRLVAQATSPPGATRYRASWPAGRVCLSRGAASVLTMAPHASGSGACGCGSSCR